MLSVIRRASIVLAFLSLSPLTLACQAELDDCKVECEEIENECQEKCSAVSCRTECEQSFEECSASCDEVETEAYQTESGN